MYASDHQGGIIQQEGRRGGELGGGVCGLPISVLCGVCVVQGSESAHQFGEGRRVHSAVPVHPGLAEGGLAASDMTYIRYGRWEEGNGDVDAAVGWRGQGFSSAWREDSGTLSAFNDC